MKTWPNNLPAPLVGTVYAPGDPQMRTPLDSGRVMVRRKFTAVPVFFRAEWVVKSDTDGERLESFYQNDLIDGTEWFLMPVLLPQGRGVRKVQFQGIYTGPERINPPGLEHGAWKYTADMLLFLRPEQDVEQVCGYAVWENIGW